MDNIEILKQGYQNFADGNVEAVIAAFQPDIVWDNSTGFPYVEGDGIYKGHQEVVEKAFAKIPEYYDGFNIKIDELIGVGDKVVMKGYYTGTWKPTGKKFKANAVHVWTFKDGKASHYFQAADTAEIINP